jgi:hypothetical protein
MRKRARVVGEAIARETGVASAVERIEALGSEL